MPNLTKTLTVYEGADLTPARNRTDDTVWEATELPYLAHDGEAEAGSWVVHNDESDPVFVRPHNLMKLTVGSNTLWQGRVAAKSFERGDTKTGNHSLLTVTTEDGNAHLRGIIVHNWARPPETDAARVQALVAAYLSGNPRASTNLNGSNYVVTGSNTQMLPPQIYSGIEPFDILTEIAEQVDKTFFVSVDDELHYYGNDYTGYSSILRISDDHADLNTVTCVPINPNGSQMSRETISTLRMYWRNPEGEGNERTVQYHNATVANQQDYWESVYHDSEAATIERATTNALAVFNASRRADFSQVFTIGAPGTLPRPTVNPNGNIGTAGQPMTGDDVWKVKPGQLLSYKSTIMRGPNAGFFTRRVKSIRWTFPAADSYFATVELESPKLISRPRGHQNLHLASNLLTVETSTAWKFSNGGAPAGWHLHTFDDSAYGLAAYSGPQAIWWDGTSSRWIYNNPVSAANAVFRTTFSLTSEPTRGVVQFAADNAGDIYVNGVLVGSRADTLWFAAGNFDVPLSAFRIGTNVLSIVATSDGIAPSGVYAVLTVEGGTSAGGSTEAAREDHSHDEFRDVNFLVGTATSTLSNEIVAGTTPGGELGGTWGSPTVDTTHAGSTHLQPVRKNSTGTVFERRRLNLIEGSNVTLTVADDSGNDEVDVTIAASTGTPTFVGAFAYSDTTQSINNTTDTKCSLNQESFDSDAFHDNATNNSRMTIPTGQGGKYLVGGMVKWDTNATGTRNIRIMKNGSTTVRGSHSVVPANAVGPIQETQVLVDLSATDYVELNVFQTSGAARTIGSASNDYEQTALWLTKVG